MLDHIQDYFNWTFHFSRGCDYNVLWMAFTSRLSIKFFFFRFTIPRPKCIHCINIHNIRILFLFDICILYIKVQAALSNNWLQSQRFTDYFINDLYVPLAAKRYFHLKRSCLLVRFSFSIWITLLSQYISCFKCRYAIRCNSPGPIR